MDNAPNEQSALCKGKFSPPIFEGKGTIVYTRTRINTRYSATTSSILLAGGVGPKKIVIPLIDCL